MADHSEDLAQQHYHEAVRLFGQPAAQHMLEARIEVARAFQFVTAAEDRQALLTLLHKQMQSLVTAT